MALAGKDCYETSYAQQAESFSISCQYACCDSKTFALEITGEQKLMANTGCNLNAFGWNPPTLVRVLF
jgi:hypothetical protein